MTDEFVEPVVLRGRPRLDPAQDTAIVFNFRPDRARQLTERLLEAGADVVTMTRYRDDFTCPVAFGEQDVPETLAEAEVTRHALMRVLPSYTVSGGAIYVVSPPLRHLPTRVALLREHLIAELPRALGVGERRS